MGKSKHKEEVASSIDKSKVMMGFLNRKHTHILTKFLNFNFLCLIVLFISSGILVLGNDVQIKIQKVSSSPKIDGYIEESFWGNLTPLKDFVQYDPYNGKPPSEETFVYLAYDEDNLYIAFNCLDSQPRKIKGDLTPRGSPILNLPLS